LAENVNTGKASKTIDVIKKKYFALSLSDIL
jgi:hypothetical protein